MVQSSDSARLGAISALADQYQRMMQAAPLPRPMIPESRTMGQYKDRMTYDPFAGRSKPAGRRVDYKKSLAGLNSKYGPIEALGEARRDDVQIPTPRVSEVQDDFYTSTLTKCDWRESADKPIDSHFTCHICDQKAIGVGENIAARTFDSRCKERYPDPRHETYTPAVVSTQRPYGSFGHAGSSDNDERNSKSTFKTHSDSDSSDDDVAIDASLGSGSCASYSTSSSFKLLYLEEFRDIRLRNAEEDLNKKTLVAQVSTLGALTSVVLGGLWYFIG
jgi:hypothetical protein